MQINKAGIVIISIAVYWLSGVALEFDYSFIWIVNKDPFPTLSTVP